MTIFPNQVTIFLSYAHEDEVWLKKLETHLSMLKRRGVISTWHNREILPGTNRAEVIDQKLEQASIILLLVSADFMASDYCYDIEMMRAMEREASGLARVIPIVVRPTTGWENAPFAHLQVLPTNTKAISVWSNEDEAFVDIVAGIQKAIEDLLPLKAPIGHIALSSIWNVPYPRNPYFTGRDELLIQLERQLKPAEQMDPTTTHRTTLAQPDAVSGLGGIGKTQIAVEYAYQHRRDYQAIFWVRADTYDSLVSGYMEIAHLLNLPQKEAQDQTIIIKAVLYWFETQRAWLLILDNADELTIVRKFLPLTFDGHILLTTRAQSMGGLAKRIEIETMNLDTGALLLLRRGGLIAPDAQLESASSSDIILAREITQDLGGLPLALDQAGAYIEETQSSISSYRPLYHKRRATLLEKRGGLVDDHPEPVATTWSLSFQRVEEKNAAAADLLRTCAFLAPDAIPEEVITKGASHLGSQLAPVAADPFLFGEMIEALRAYSLLDRDPQSHHLSVHRLVQTVLKDKMDKASYQTWAERAVLVVTAAFPYVTPEKWPLCELLLPHALICITLIDEQNLITSEAAQLLNRTGYYLKERARYEEAEVLLQKALIMQEFLLGSNHPDTALSLNDLAMLHDIRGNEKQAEVLFKRALAIREQQLGPEDLYTSDSLKNLAVFYLWQEKHEQAEPLLKRALAIRQQQLGPEHFRTAAILNDLANLYYHQGEYEQAEVLFKQALAIRQQQDPLAPGTGITLNNLANLYYHQERYEQAELLYKRSLEIHELKMGPEHPSTANILDNLANFYYHQEKYEQAEPLCQKVLSIREKHLDPQHPNTVNSAYNLALLYDKQGKYGQAEPLYKRVLTFREQKWGAEHPDTVSSLNDLANLYHHQGKYEQAELLYQHALFICERVLGQYPITRIVHENYTSFLRMMRGDEKAKQLDGES